MSYDNLGASVQYLGFLLFIYFEGDPSISVHPSYTPQDDLPHCKQLAGAGCGGHAVHLDVPRRKGPDLHSSDTAVGVPDTYVGTTNAKHKRPWKAEESFPVLLTT